MKSLIPKFFSALIISLFFATQVSAFYNDVPETHEYYESIKTLYDLGKLPDSENFEPDEYLRKQDLYQFILTYGGSKITLATALPYSDIDNNSPYAPYIQTAINLNILKPSSFNTEFEPNQTISKHFALSAMFKTLGIGTDYFFDHDTFPFEDLKVNSNTAVIAQKAAELGIFETPNMRFFKMAKRITKAEAADYLYKIYQYSPDIAITIEFSETDGIVFTDTDKTLINHESFETFLDVWTILQTEYFHKDEINFQDLIFGAIRGMTDKLSDKYTVFQEPDEAEAFMDSLSNEFEGIGIVIDLIEDDITIISPLKDSPAETVGLKSNDIIIKVDGESVIGESLAKVVSLIKGEKDTEVKITVLRDGKEKTYTVIRDFILLNTIESEILKGPGGKNIGHIRIISFGERTYEDFDEAARDLLEEDIDGLIVDLRSNPGGYMDVAVNIISLFVDKIKTAVTLRFADGSEENYKTNGNELLKDIETVVLINEGSASASEILAGALKDYGIAKLIGKKSFGKGSVQEIAQYKDNSLLKYTISNWLTPNGTNINGEGFEPDIEISNTENNDNQLDRALEEFF